MIPVLLESASLFTVLLDTAVYLAVPTAASPSPQLSR